MTTSNNIVAAGTYHSDKFEYVNQKLREHFQRSQDEIEKVKEKVNELVVIVHNDNKDWSLKKISDYIAGKNDDLEELGFSSRTIYNYLNEENRKLLNHTGRPRGMLQNIDIEQRFESVQTNVPEESSSKKILPTAYEVKNAEVGEAVDEIYEIDDDDDDDDDQEEEQRIIQFKYVLTIKDQDFPLIVTCYPDLGTGNVELDEKEVRKLRRF